MDFEIWAYPIAIISDRYQGTYSGGKWLAIAGIGVPGQGQAVLSPLEKDAEKAPNPWGDDLEAADFWQAPPSWIAVGDTPEEALAALRKKAASEDVF
jgi:hypothetical protein